VLRLGLERRHIGACDRRKPSRDGRRLPEDFAYPDAIPHGSGQPLALRRPHLNTGRHRALRAHLECHDGFPIRLRRLQADEPSLPAGRVDAERFHAL